MDAAVSEYAALERLYVDNPGRYRRKVLGLVALGYAYVAASVLIVLAVVVGGAALFVTGTVSLIYLDNFIKAGVPLVAVAGLMARAVFVRLPRPEGIYLTGAAKAAVLQFFEDVRRAAHGPKIDHVVVDNRLNAAVQQMPRFGLFGPPRNYLILGAPLLQLLNAREMRAVIAHEFGHLSHEHGRMGAAVYRLNHTLAAAAQAVAAKKKSDAGLLGLSFRFLRWFWERFDKLTFPMRRGQEYEADAVSARATSGADLASALCKLHALDEPYAAFWDGIWRRARQSATNRDVFPARELRLRPPSTGEGAEAAVARALQRETDYRDTHPALKDRLRALEVAPATAFAAAEPALDAIFSEAERAALLEQIDAMWQRDSRANWEQAHRQYREAEQELAELRRREAELDAGGLYQLARLTENLDGLDAARDAYRRLAERHPDNAAAQFHWARAEFEDAFATAEQAFYRAMDLDPELVPHVVPYLRAGYERTRRTAALPKLDAYMQRFEELRRKADAERAAVRIDDELIPAGFTAEEKAVLAAYLSMHPEVRKLYVAEKKITHFQGDRVFLLGFDVNTYHDNVEVNEDKWLERIVDGCSRALPVLNAPFALIVKKRSLWRERLEQLDGALVYTRQLPLKTRIWYGVKQAYSTVIALVLLGALAYVIYAAVLA